FYLFFFLTDPPPTVISTLSLHDALPIFEAVDLTEQELLVRLDDGREIRYPFANLYALTHAYAVSDHKAQGAEFPAVVIPLVTSRSEEHTSELQSLRHLVCRLLLEKKKND